MSPDEQNALVVLAATLYADTRPTINGDCPRCNHAINRLELAEQIHAGNIPNPDPEPPRYEPVPEAIEWLITKHPALWWLATLPQNERDWYHHPDRADALARLHPDVTAVEWRLVLDPNMYARTA